MAAVPSSQKRRLLATLGFTLWAASSCSQEPTLPPVLSDAERPTAAEIARAPEVDVCGLNSRPDYLDELVRARARLPSGVVAAIRCEGSLVYLEFDEARMKRLSSSEAMRNFYQVFGIDEFDNRRFGRRVNFDVLVVGRFTKLGWPSFSSPPDSPDSRKLVVYAIERVTPLESAR